LVSITSGLLSIVTVASPFSLDGDGRAEVQRLDGLGKLGDGRLFADSTRMTVNGTVESEDAYLQQVLRLASGSKATADSFTDSTRTTVPWKERKRTCSKCYDWNNYNWKRWGGFARKATSLCVKSAMPAQKSPQWACL
jgi:hypothetical protein